MKAGERSDVLVLGGGAAGLAAAAELAAAGRSVRLLEAGDGLGGRIRTVLNPLLPAPIELGAEFVHGRPETTWRLMREADAVAYDVTGDHWQKRGGRLVRLDDFGDQLGRIMRRLNRIADDMSFSQFLEQHCAGDALRDARRLARAFVEGFDAADPDRVSALAIRDEQEGVGDIGTEPQFRIRGGYRTLIEHLNLQRIEHGADLVMRMFATEVHWRPGDVRVIALDRDDQPHTFEANQAVVTVPLPLLQQLRFVPDVAEKRAAIGRLGFGSVVKVVLNFREPFWEDESIAKTAAGGESLVKAGFLHDADARFPTWWTALPVRAAMLTAWAGGPKADALHGLNHDGLIDVALETLAELLQQPIERPRDLLVAAHACDWLADPFTRGAYSYIAVNGRGAREALAKPIANTLFFAGEATDTSGQAATVAGALASGRRAAREILDQ